MFCRVFIRFVFFDWFSVNISWYKITRFILGYIISCVYNIPSSLLRFQIHIIRLCFDMTAYCRLILRHSNTMAIIQYESNVAILCESNLWIWVTKQSHRLCWTFSCQSINIPTGCLAQQTTSTKHILIQYDPKSTTLRIAICLNFVSINIRTGYYRW